MRIDHTGGALKLLLRWPDHACRLCHSSLQSGLLVRRAGGAAHV